MDITSPLKPDVYRVTTVLLVPGVVATLPWLFWWLWPELGDAGTWGSAAIPILLLLTAISVAVGVLLEEFGCIVELEIVDRYVAYDKRIPIEEFNDNWKDYLLSRVDDSMVVRGYVRHLVTRMKFQLSMAPASLSFAAACLIVGKFPAATCPSVVKFVLGFAAIFLAIWLVYRAAKIGWQLHEIRCWILSNQSKASNSGAAASTSASNPAPQGSRP